MKFIEIDTNQSPGCIKLMQIHPASSSDASIRMKINPTSHRCTEFHRFSHKSATFSHLLRQQLTGFLMQVARRKSTPAMISAKEAQGRESARNHLDRNDSAKKDFSQASKAGCILV
jgi:hypothetical protein